MIRLWLIWIGEQAITEHIPTLLEMQDRFSIIALCDISNSSIQKGKLLVPNAKTYNLYHEMFSSENLDATLISLPHNLHYEVTMAAITNNLHIIKDKPFAINTANAHKIISAAKLKERKIVTLLKRNKYPSYYYAQKYLSLIGRVYQYNAEHYVTGGNIHEWWKSLTSSAWGGIVVNLGYHLLDQIIQLFWEPIQVNAHISNIWCENTDYEVEDAASILLKHKEVHGTISLNCYSGTKREFLEIHGTKWTIQVWKNEFHCYDTSGKTLLTEKFDSPGIHSSIQLFDSITAEDFSAFINDMNKNLSIVKTIERIYESVLIPKNHGTWV